MQKLHLLLLVELANHKEKAVANKQDKKELSTRKQNSYFSSHTKQVAYNSKAIEKKIQNLKNSKLFKFVNYL